MKSIYLRVLFVTIYTIAICGFLGFYVANLYDHWALKPRLDAKLLQMASSIGAHMERFPDRAGDFLSNAAGLGYQIYLHDAAGNDMFYGGAFQKRDLPEETVHRVLSGEEFHGIATYPYRPFVPSYFDNRLSNSVGIRVMVEGEPVALFLRHDTRLQFDELQVFFVLMYALTILFSIPYLLFSTRYLVQPIVRLTEATKRVAQGDFNLRLPTSRKDEIGRLASHFRDMAARLERMDRSKKEFVANVSHEIQSPLASIQGFADSLLSENLEPERIRHYAEIIGQETRQLTKLSKQLLLLSTLEHGSDAVCKGTYLLQTQLRQALQLFEWQLAEKEIAVRMVVPAGMTVYGDEVLLMQIWTNLLSNAVKHIPPERSIEIEAKKTGGESVVCISDNGDGIEPRHIPYLFDRFYRGDAARQRGEGSTGLGLSIVQKIVHLHGGTIEAASETGMGTTFRVRLPEGENERLESVQKV
ncbi:sensor histidine kinase [Paenibacillus nanensis]|uniref:Heme sensor protein HssS n=1 Tax=Paenibacillus nanensis TaxID=393251 RepID=A0A3A1UV53_9BACL|nr:HAMP domain-containing sensor histidine kinase [Paenibacillus nanensis]RIX47927.1 sensor histidine kinase [Paenibacillus nanensis]